MMVSPGATGNGSGVICLTQARRAHQARCADVDLAPSRALVIGAHLPLPGRSVALDRVASHLRGLQALGYAVTVLATEEPEMHSILLESLGIHLPRSIGPDLAETLRRAGRFDLVYLHGTRVDLVPTLRAALPAARLVLALQGALRGSSPLRHDDQLDAVLAPSAAAVPHLRQRAPRAAIRVVPGVVPLRRAGGAGPDPATRHGLGFLQQGDAAADQEAAAWLVHGIMPLVWQADPTIGCVLVGRGLRHLAGGRVCVLNAPGAPDRVRLTVAPFRGGPVPSAPVLASLGARLPCVMTGAAAATLNLTPALRACVADDAAEIARLILHLHGNAGTARGVVRAGAAMLRRDHSESAMLQALAAACGLEERLTAPA